MNRKNIQKLAAQLVGLTSSNDFRATDVEIEEKIAELAGEIRECSRCHRQLVVLHHSDYVELEEGIVCMPCMGGS